LLKENPLKMSEFLGNKYFFNEISPSNILIPEKEEFLKGQCPSLTEFLKNNNFVYGQSSRFARILEK
jgi:hypothetical protein